MAESGGASTPKLRKLWIDSTPFAPVSLKDQKCKDSSPPVVKLTHFAQKPYIDFGNVKVGKSKCLQVLVENPNDYDVDVKVEKFPWKKNFKLNEEFFAVTGDGYHVLEICWTPTAGGVCREVVMMKYDLGFRVHAVIVGHAEEPKKKPNSKGKRIQGKSMVKKTRTMPRKASCQSAPLLSNRENLNPLLHNAGSIQCEANKYTELQHPTTKATVGSPRSAVGLSEGIHNTIRKALVPLHVVNAESSRDSCGSITAPASPSGLEAPIIASKLHSPMFSPSLENRKASGPRDTYCIGTKPSPLAAATVITPQTELTGRPTFFLPQSANRGLASENAFNTPIITGSKSDGTPSRCMTPRSHRRSRTYTKNVVKDGYTEKKMLAVDPVSKASNAPSMLDNALDMIRSNDQTKESGAMKDIEKYHLTASSCVSEDSLDMKLIKTSESSEHVSSPERCIPSVLMSTVDKNGSSIASSKEETVERLSSTYNHGTEFTDPLPVPDISAIGYSSSSRNKRSKCSDSSSNKNLAPTSVASSNGFGRKRTLRPSPKSRKRVVTPKHRVLQCRPNPKPIGTSPLVKSSKRLAGKTNSASPAKKLRCSLKASTSRRHARTPRSTKKRKVKMPIKRLVLKPTAKSSQPAKVTYGMPFLSRNRFYDEKWRQKQEYAFTAWLNFILTPDEFKASFQWNTTIASSKKDKQKSMTKETASLRAYEIEKRRHQLHRAGFMLYESADFTKVLECIEEAVESSHIALREDKQLWADIGNRGKVVDMLMSFNPLWLRLGLEIAFAEERVTLNTLEPSVLSGFITKKLLSNSFIEREFAHPTVPHSYRAGYNEKISKHMLKKFLILILFLDQAKQKRLIDHDPCLFNKGAKFRNCKDILQVFSRDLLRGEGDIIKHLGFYGYRVSYQQTFIDEFDFGINNVAVDLRDGIRLVRIVELLFHRHDLTSQLRVPAGSLLQKKHNVNVAMKALEQQGVEMCDANGKKIESEHIVKGHCEMTLSLLWNMALFFQVERGIDEKALKDEIEYLKKTLKLKHVLEDTENLHENEDSPSFIKPVLSGISSLLLEWARLVCAFKSVPVYNFSASFSDGRVLSCLIAHYQSSLIHPLLINMVTTFNQKDNNDTLQLGLLPLSDLPVQEEMDQKLLLKNEKVNLRLVQSALYEMGGIPNLLRIDDICNTIPDEKVVRLLLSYLCSRLLDITSQDRAARTIQVSWRAYRYKKRSLAEKIALAELKRQQNKAAFIIQSAYKRYQLRMAVKKRIVAAITIQRSWRRKLEARPVRIRFLKIREAVIKIQALFRGHLAQKLFADLREEQVRRGHAALVIQNGWRRVLLRQSYLHKIEAAIKIQRALRNYWSGKAARTSYLNYKSAVVVIQKRWRATQLMRKEIAIFTTKRESLIVIQRAFRKFRYLRRVSAAMMIQRWWRALRKARQLQQRRMQENSAAAIIQSQWKAYMKMRTQREIYLKTIDGVIKIQSMLRCCLAKRQLSELKKRNKCAETIQNFWKGYILMKKQRCEYVIKKQAVVTIQSAYRTYCVKKVFERKKLERSSTIVIQQRWKATLKMREQKLAFQVMRHSALTIQSFWRGYLLMKNQRNEFLMKKNCAIVIQKIWRGHCAKKITNKMKLEINSAKAIQQRWRATLEMRKQVKIFQSKRKSAIVIQSLWRGVVERKRLLRMQSSVTIIQTRLRAMIQMKKQRARYITIRNSILTIQSLWRGFAIRKRIRLEREAVEKIQKYWGGFVLMKKERNEFLLKKEAALKIQSLYRAYTARKRVHNLKLEICSATVIQRRWRATLEMRKQVKLYQMKRDSAITIQSYWKGHVVKKHILQQHNSATIIQTWWRAILEMRKQRKCYVTMRASAIVVQSSWRGFTVRRRLKKLRKSVETIENHWTGFKLMKVTRKEFLRQKQAALKIQAAFRGQVARKFVRKIRLEISSAIVIQQRWKALCAMRKQSQQFRTLRKAVITIQSFWRSFAARKYLLKQQNSVRAIQSWWRATLKMRQQREIFSVIRENAIKIQSTWRGFVVRKRIAKTRKSVEIIEIFWKNFVLMKNQRRQFLQKKQAALKIQTAYRGYAARKLMNIRRLELSSAITIQQNWRALLNMRKERNEYRLLRRSAVTIQRFWKGILLTKIERMEFLTKKRAAVQIQCTLRGFMARKMVKRKKLEVKSVIVIQSRWIATLNMRKQREIFQNLRKSAVIIQSTWRGFAVRKQIIGIKKSTRIIQAWWMATQKTRRLSEEFKTMRESAVVIQSHWKGLVVRKNLVQAKQSAVSIQRYWRGRMLMLKLRQEFVTKRRAASTIQTAYRGFVGRKVVKSMKLRRKSAIVIQQKWKATLRMKKQRTEFLKVINCVIMIQSFWRRQLQRRSAELSLRRNKSAETIQQYWRGLLLLKTQRRDFLRLKYSAIKIQSLYRGFLARKFARKLKLEKESCIILQNRWRATLEMRKQRKHFLLIRRNVVTLQSMWKGFAVRKLMREKKQAVKKIEIWWSAVLEMRIHRRSFLKMKNCCIVFQCALRSYVSRKKLTDLKKRNRAAVVIQNWFKATTLMQRQRQCYQEQKLAAVKIQSFFRMVQSKSIVKERKLVKSAILIQKRWKATLLMREYRRKFLQIKQSAKVLQSLARMVVAKTLVARMRKEKNAAMLIQKTWRSYKQMTIDVKKFVEIRSAAVTIQSFIRGTHARRKLKVLKAKQKSAVIIQRWFRSVSLTRRLQNEYLRKISAITVMQRFFKRTLTNKQSCRLRQRRAAIVIQRKWRATLLMQRQRSEFLRVRSSTITLQTSVRRFLAVKAYQALKMATVTIQRKRRHQLRARHDRLNFMRVLKAVVLIQRVYRGYCVRKHIKDEKVLVAKEKCVKATHNANKFPERKICNRMNSALSVLLRAKSYDVVYSTLEDLISLSKLLPYCCERISDNGGTAVLCELVSSCNRSFHAAFVQHFTISILLNLLQNTSTRFDTTQVLISETAGSMPIEMLVTVLSRFREKGNRDASHAMVFCSACSLLIEFCRESENVKILQGKQKSVDMIKFIAKETNNRIQIKAQKQKQAIRKKKRETTSFLTMSSGFSEDSHSLLDISCRNTTFSERVASPRVSLRKADSENRDPANSRKNVDTKNAAAKKIVTKLFHQENSTQPKIKQVLVPRKALWHTNVPIQRSKEVTIPHSPNFKGRAREKSRHLQAPAGNPEKIRALPQSEVRDVELKNIEYDHTDQVSCINALANVLT